MDYNYIKYMTLNKDWYYDKVYACWLGKNIGGTIGAPYEGTKEMLDIKGFKTKPGEPLPNDDLDLQLLWLFIVEREGINKVNQNLLAEYWVDWIPPHWNEYGIARQNLKSGLLPPLSGEIENKRWQTSNGAWIRSEVWALLFPYCGDVAMKYASMDAMVDHGISEGTYAEIFTVAIQNAAIYNSDIMSIIENALTKIPKDCLISKAVRLVI
ncbi:MAG: ADP-ribosylglycohydrolase family protein, partial [Clostridia bacterium]|nr:ADP-ribosylglycohydrolase family protein [Clostridia bacterium]